RTRQSVTVRWVSTVSRWCSSSALPASSTTLHGDRATPRQGRRSALRRRRQRRRPEVWLPVGAQASGRHEEPHALPWLRGRPAEGETDLVDEPVLLAGVAAPAGGDHVVPGVGPALAAGHDVVDVLRRRAAVLAAMTVPGEDRPAVERHPALVRH